MVLHIRKVLKVRAARILGFVKDRASIERVRLRADRRIAVLQVCVISATSHDEQPPSKELVRQVLQAGTGSRMRVSHCLNVVMHRLGNTRSWVVALKCLTLIHKALQHGGFIYEDQILSLQPRSHGAGKHYLNLSQFRDRSSPLAWQASSWIRWYAGFLEALIIVASNPTIDRSASLQNDDILAGILSLDTLLREICSCPTITDMLPLSHVLIGDAFRLVVKDSIAKQNELQIHIKEICQRLNDLTVLQQTELVRVCEVLISESAKLVKLRELAISINLLPSKARLESVFFTEDELLHIKAALKMALQVSSAEFAWRKGPVRKDIESLGAFNKPVKLSSLRTLKDYRIASR